MARRYSKKASRKVKRAMHERKRGTLRSGRSGRKVKSRQSQKQDRAAVQQQEEVNPGN